MYENRNTKPIFGLNASILKHYCSAKYHRSRGVF